MLLVLRRRSSFKFVEVGVFKGDNAVRVIEVAKRFTTSIQYVGFDLFEDNEAFFELHAEDRAEYDNPVNSYWEFQSGQHTLAQVHSKLSTVLAEADFTLVEGN